ncbi:Retrotransposon gag protein [Rhizoctonia solani]|uniref:Retrotransposon gag protein n=1 Tax=Rhizoctonia solani TaxID=456999 RepID=A0A8H7IKG4_9AGAM|nr:Retrotransposon gag protein [Rhizoctonia solani]
MVTPSNPRQPIHPLAEALPASRLSTAVDQVPTLSNITSRTPHVLPPGHPPTLAGPTPHIPWQPAPGRPLKPLPINQGELGPFLPPASPELGKVSLEQVIRLLGAPIQVDRIERTLSEQAEVSQEVQTNVKNISQMVDVVKDGLAQLQSARGPIPQKNKNPRGRGNSQGRAQSQPIGKAQPFLGAPAPIISTGAPGATPSPFSTLPFLVLPFRTGSSSQGPPPAPVITPALPPAPSTVKVDHPDAFKGKIGLEAKQWLTRMLAWVRLNQRQFPSDMEVLSFLLMNMTEAAGAWAHPHLDQLGSHRALIQTVDEFKTKFLAAFGDPTLPEQRSGRLLPSHKPALVPNILLSSARCKWNLIGTMPHSAVSLRGLHWEVRKQIATRERQPRTLRELQDAALIIDNALRKEQASHPQQGISLARLLPPPIGGRVPANRPPKPVPSPNPNYVSEEERNRRRAEGLCVKCERSPLYNFNQAREKAEQLEALIDSGATSSFMHPRTAELLRLPLIDLPLPRTVTMLNGLSPQAGKIWKKANLTFSFDGKRMTETFLICNTGSHAAILGLKWLDAHNPEIDWNSRTLSFPHTPPEHVSIAEEEEATNTPLKESLPDTINTLSMTDAESATLKDWLRDELKAGKIRPSKSSISSP